MAGGNSYNGWPANSDPAAIDVKQNLWFPGGVKTGDVTTVLRYVAEQFNARVEPIISGWCWGYTYKQNVNNPSSLSCHASGTALDVNAPDHPNGSGGTFSDAQVGTIYAILNEVQGAVDWLEGYDEMHFEIAVNAADLAAIAAQLPAGGGGTPPPEEDDLPYSKEELTQCAASGFARGAKEETLAIGDGPVDAPTPMTLEDWAKQTNDRIWRLEQAAGTGG